MEEIHEKCVDKDADSKQLLTNEQLRDFHETFKLFDKDGDGRLSKRDLADVMKKLGQSMTEDQLQKLVMDVGKDGNGDIEFSDFLAVMTKNLSDNQTEHELQKAFNFFDKDNDGLISAVELRDVMLRLGENVTVEECAAIIDEADQNGDGKIDFHDFCTILMSP
mmetsp:Transcript_24345/g.41895  ORF Transcript_24345/g.41895 Transcript_24345/m.41895 type:complete len:164 (-) Transcript_24345:1032-1523(-)|eukprot:CAMPEP_0196659718 /NCGR_PEP_ID=MMETSP1086-20130531/36388_1 /TAXON_ID=77921 /ORGANISM="Cyanoptyche  gloeocystis , Strain SAG4.97" /LENGTH=163 /DNA_ID=CAMNT_0041993805 /DNA_START=238 /DNA_END=729 /DNA_ORIENTATION=-